MTDQPIEISSLPVDQLQRIIQALDQDVKFLQNSYNQLKIASNKFIDSGDCLTSFKPQNKGKEIFVPMTSSLYVPGKLSNVDTVLVDIGTGYFAEKSIADAKDYIDRRVKDIDGKAQQIEKMIEQKRKSLVQIQMVFQAKRQLLQQQMQKSQ